MMGPGQKKTRGASQIRRVSQSGQPDMQAHAPNRYRFFVLTPSGSRATLDENRPVFMACDACGTQLKGYSFSELLSHGPGEIPPCPYCSKLNRA